MQLRDYQEESINRTRQSLARNKRVILQLPTGAGKTVIAGSMIRSAVEKGKTVAFICDRLNLIDQTSASFHSQDIDHGVIQGDHWMTNYSKQVQVCSIQTLARRKFRHHADLVIIDEAHGMYKAILKMLATWNSHFVGLTATPYAKGMGLHWDDLIVGATTKQLIDKGYLSDFEVYAPPIPSLSGVSVSRGEYNTAQLASRLNQRKPVGDIVDTWHKYGENNQTICFAVNIEHSKHIVEQFRQSGVEAAHIDAYTDTADTRRVLKDYREGRIKLVSCVDILTKGADFPDTSTLIQGAAKKSLISHLQQVGRSLRIAPNKEKAIILDHGANVERHGFPTDASLPNRLDVTPPSGKVAERKEPTPKACPRCQFVKEIGERLCPKCGFETQRFNTVEHEAGELVKIKGVKHTKEYQQEFFSGLLGYAKEKGFSQGWAAHSYKAKFKQWPNGLNRVVKEPDQAINNWVKHLNIKRRFNR
jgi:DNA repair protein RadD